MSIALRWTLKDLIRPFVVIALCIVCYGLVSAARALVEAILGVIASAIRHVPLIGGLGDAAITKAENYISHALGETASGLENTMGRYWHALAAEVTAIGEAIALIAQELWHLTVVSVDHAFLGHVYDLIRALRRRVQALAAAVADVPAVVVPKVVTITKPVTRVIVQKASALAGELEHVIEWDLPRLRARERALADDLARLWKWSRAHARQIGTAAATAAALAVLSKIGAGWLKCRNWRHIGRAGCALDASLLDELLLDGLLIFGVLSVVEFARTLQSIEDEALAVAHTMIREFPAP